MFTIEFNINTMSETVYFESTKLFTRNLFYCLNYGIGENIDALKAELQEEYTHYETYEYRYDIDDIRCRYDEEYMNLLFTNLLFQYVEKFNEDALHRRLEYLYFIFGNVVMDSDDLYIDQESNRSNGISFCTGNLRYFRQKFIKAFDENRSKYNVEYIEDLCIATLAFIIKNDFNINMCHNCHRCFVPHKRLDELYCDRIAPQSFRQKKSMSCKEYASAHLWYDRIKKDPVLKLYRNIYNAKQMLVRRNPDITAYADNFDLFKRESLEWKKRYKAGECTADEFKQWLDEQKARKT